MNNLGKYIQSQIKCPKCSKSLDYMGTFEGRVRWYCTDCEEEILNFPWSSNVAYPQDTAEPSPSTYEGNRWQN
jgi:hypothetical protein